MAINTKITVNNVDLGIIGQVGDKVVVHRYFGIDSSEYLTQFKEVSHSTAISRAREILINNPTDNDNPVRHMLTHWHGL